MRVSSPSSSGIQARSLGLTIFGEIFAYVTVFYSSCPVPHHTNCSPELQDPCSINFFNLRHFKASESFFFILCLLVKTYLRIINQFITAQP